MSSTSAPVSQIRPEMTSCGRQDVSIQLPTKSLSYS